MTDSEFATERELVSDTHLRISLPVITVQMLADYGQEGFFEPYAESWGVLGVEWSQAAINFARMCMGAAGKHAERVLELEAEVSTLREHLTAKPTRCPSCDTITPNHFSWCELPSSPREASACTCPPGYCCEASGAASSAQRICRGKQDTP